MKSRKVTVDDCCEVCSYPLICIQSKSLVSLAQSLFFCELGIVSLQITSQYIVFVVS